MFFFDTIAPVGHTSAKLRKEMTYDSWKNNFCPTHGFSASLRISSMCPTIPWSLQDEKLFVLGSVSLHGLCPTYLSRKFERYRSLPSFGSTETLPHGYPEQSVSQYLSSRQPGERLADLRGLCPDSYCPSSASLCHRFLWSGIESNRICFGLHSHRFMSFPFPLGQVPEAQRSDQITHPLGSARKHSVHRHHYPWEGSRCDHSRSTELRTRSLLYLRSRLSRFRSPLCDSSSFSLFRDPSQKQFQVQTSLFSTGRQIQGRSIRPNHRPQGVLRQKGLPRKIETDSLVRRHPKQMVRLSNQQFYASRIGHRSALPPSLADRIILQMDQAAPPNQGLLWHERQCRQDPDLDRHHRLCAGGHHQKATEIGKESLHNPTDFERHSFRKKPNFRGFGEC